VATAPEVLALERLHQAVQARIGIAAAYLSLAEWQAVAALTPETTAAVWLAVSLRTILAAGKLSSRAAAAYYRLARALETGRTMGDPDEAVTLGQLRRDFRDLAIDVAATPYPRSPNDDPDIRWFEQQLASLQDEDLPISLRDAEVDPLIQELLDAEGADRTIEVDDFEWPDDPILEDIEEAYSEMLRQQAVKRLADKVQALRSSEDLTPDQALSLIDESHAAAGSNGSGTVDAASIAPGRAAIDTAARSDKTVLAVARGTSSDPCAFCAMLASRGFVYKSDQSAHVGDDDVAKKVHVHCHCFPIYRWVKESELPPMNRYFQAKWPEVTAGHGGKDALNAWRRWIYSQRKANPEAPHGTLNTTT